jgi:hypothetical protein
VPIFAGISAIFGDCVTHDKQDLTVVHFINGGANPAFHSHALIVRSFDLNPSVTKFAPKAGRENQVPDQILLLTSPACLLRSRKQTPEFNLHGKRGEYARESSMPLILAGADRNRIEFQEPRDPHIIAAR